MYSTIQSRVSLKAGAAFDNLPGLKSEIINPVLCCPIVEAVVPVVEAALGTSTGIGIDAATNNGGEGQGQCPGSSLDFTAAVTYIPPGRLTANHTPVSDNASVDELIATVRN